MYILIPNKINPIRYVQIKKLMYTLKAPFIDVFKFNDNIFYALEGSHRVTCAKELNLIPILNVITDMEFYKEDNTLYIIKQNIVSRINKGLFVEF